MSKVIIKHNGEMYRVKGEGDSLLAETVEKINDSLPIEVYQYAFDGERLDMTIVFYDDPAWVRLEK